MPERRLAAVQAVAFSNGTLFTHMWRGERPRRHDQNKCECGTGDRPTRKVSSNRWVLTSQSTYPPIQQITSLKPNRPANYLLVPIRQAKDGGSKHKRAAFGRSIVGENLGFVSHVVRKASQRWNPEKRARKKSIHRYAKRITATHMSGFVCKHRDDLLLGESVQQAARSEHAR